MMTKTRNLALLILALATAVATAADWPQWMGPQRDGVWRETGLLKTFPQGGPRKVWSVPIDHGYAGPAVANGLLVVMDRVAEEEQDARKAMAEGVPGKERVLCFHANDGKKAWEHSYDVLYKISYPSGPRTTPLIDGELVYCLGAMGHLFCLRVDDGIVVWQKNFMEEFAMQRPLVWGWSAHPLIDGNQLICLVGGKGAGVVAFDKKSGAELWRSVNAKEIGYAPPVIHESNGHRQLIVWHDVAVRGLELSSGKQLWNIPFPAYEGIQRPAVTISNPTLHDNRLFVSDFYNGSLMLELSDQEPDAEELWSSPKDIAGHKDTLNTLMAPAIIRDGHIYGFAGTGELRCLKANSGEVVWRTYEPVGGGPALFATVFIVPNEDRYFLYTDQGELIIANMDASGYEEISRTKLLKPTSFARGRDIVWSHPAFANKRIYARNDEELVCFDLENQQTNEKRGKDQTSG